MIALMPLIAAAGAGPRLHGGAPAGTAPSAAQVPTGEAAAHAQCTVCHKFPPPDVLPRSVWRDEIARMFAIRSNLPEPRGPQGTASRLVRLPEHWQAIASYYDANAPERLSPPEAWPAPEGESMFRKRVLSAPQAAFPAAIANIRLVDLEHDGRLTMVLSDMRNGAVYRARAYEAAPVFVTLATLSSPAHIDPIDLDRDGILDFLVADLGRFVPSDHHFGAVTWLRGQRDGTYVPTTLGGWPRVADVEAADFDGDGRPDVAVAAFGWRRTGELAILKNEAAPSGMPSFVRSQIDGRTGSIHAIPFDLNGDKRPDIIALFAQEHETVVAFLNAGGMDFDPQIIYAAPHPNWGSSGIQVVDLDRDGDADVLLTNGDAFDDSILKPYHAIQWLENRGTFPFTAHLLATMPGVSRAQAVDLDGDGDLDIVACALVPSDDVDMGNQPSLVWLEQTSPGRFERHVLEVGLARHATLDAADVDNDGDVDIVVGNFNAPGQGTVEIFENLRAPRGSSGAAAARASAGFGRPH
ncbi:MAG: hypothetical protein V7647_1830 [Acidobacteriota bacterium]